MISAHTKPSSTGCARAASRASASVYEAEAGLFFLDKSLEIVVGDALARLVTFPKVLVTSHQAYYTEHAVGQIIDTPLQNVLDYRAGRRSDNVLVPSAAKS